jgi:signal transduction histidine kinase
VRQEVEQEHQLHPVQHGRCILVVDDEPLIRSLCTRVLKGYRILIAESGEKALQLLDREAVDVVLTDVKMPGMSGLDLLRAIKEKDPAVVVVVMTGYADKEVILQALKADADDFISKPVNLLQLKTTIDKVLEKKALQEQLVHLKHMDRLKSDFLGLISHKLKTPVTSISLFIQNLVRNMVDPHDPSFRRMLDMILKESNYLGYLIQDLLLYSEVILQDRPIGLEDIDLRELALAVLAEKKPMAEEKGVLLLHTLPETWPTMKLDRQKIGFVLHALMDNAVKFTPPGGTILLAGRVEADEVTIVISDTGPGIPAEELPKIWEKFYQVDPDRTGQVRGFGLGLHYARQFVQNHGGSLHLKSAQGFGTEAIITLPCSSGEAAGP